ncbi:hypothetical protein [Bradyrhizobium sp. SZCCHNS3051]|uniref:hypothetical protein n=1 Tax=Bradyrhizobium TaxID=374 RepID=UPI002917101F|nr:hypothetical protein [Bradyrhizobium sp. SZCCHNS3051]
MAERLKITIRASGAHVDVLTVQDAMRQVLDIFELLEAEKDPAVEWKLAKATTNSPFHIEAEAVSLQPAVDVTVIARAQKLAVANGLREVADGRFPDTWERTSRISTAKRLFLRNLNGIGATTIDFEIGEPITVTPTVAGQAIRTLERRPTDGLYEFRTPKQQIGSVVGTLSELGTHWSHPAIKIVEARSNQHLWCRLTPELMVQFEDRTSFKDIWEHRRVIVRGRLRYDDRGALSYVNATDIEKIDRPTVSTSDILDPEFTGDLSISEYLNRFRDGSIG